MAVSLYFQKGSRNMFYEMNIAGLKRQLPLCKVTDDLYIAAFIMFSDVEITTATAAALLEKSGVAYEKLLVEENRELAAEYGLKQVPALIIKSADTYEKYVGVAEIKSFLA